MTLRLNSNFLESLPQSLGCLDALKYLDVSKNNLFNLPGSIRNLKLSTLDVSNNNFIISVNNVTTVRFKLPSLVELGAKIVYQARFVIYVI